mmetsp:Transcript_22650/g.64759  ORF Transcript_22650/g.64759 Transcript_22650/m.64759 type:complete len:106 (-) Transcript_22650:287-604(-)
MRHGYVVRLPVLVPLACSFPLSANTVIHTSASCSPRSSADLYSYPVSHPHTDTDTHMQLCYAMNECRQLRTAPLPVRYDPSHTVAGPTDHHQSSCTATDSHDGEV